MKPAVLTSPTSADRLPEPALDTAVLEVLLREHITRTRPRLERLWSYYRNPSIDSTASAGRSRLAQTAGLPPRLSRPIIDPASGLASSREVVIENDIGWRIHALADFMFGQPLVIQSLADQPDRARQITNFLQQTFQSNGGHDLFHHLALLGSIYGTLDLLVRPASADTANSAIQIELVEAPRAVPLLHPGDYRRLDAFIVHQTQLTPHLDAGPWLSRVLRRPAPATRRRREQTEVWTAHRYQRYLAYGSATTADRELVADLPNPLGRIPVVHIQNLAQPFAYEGLSDVEPLIPLQDELNTRLSDRANRVTFQSFKMYLGKGIDGFTDRPVGPGQMWATDNPDAAIHEFGGDASTPSEDHHIREIREAMDKTSGVSPLAAGVVGGRTGNLSSENAIRIVLLGLLARIEKKRLTYGRGIQQLCELILHTADLTGQLPNDPDERRVRLDWPAPFPDSQTQQLQNARLKQELGVPRPQILAELGYADCPDHH